MVELNNLAMNQTKVVVISGASGCGKTTLVRALAATFNCPYLHFDDHVEGFTYPKNMQAWYKSSADVCAIKTPALVTSLQDLLLEQHRFIFIEEPFGRERPCIAPFIDYVVLLDLPLELCLARVIRRNLSHSGEKRMQAITEYLVKYEDYFRDIYLDKVNQVKANCDLILDENHSVQINADRVASWLESITEC